MHRVERGGDDVAVSNSLVAALPYWRFEIAQRLALLDVSLQIQERCNHRKGRKFYVKAGMRNAQWVRLAPQRKCKVRY